MSSGRAWDRHYTREKSVLAYPDENLVRMLKPWTDSRKGRQLSGLDLGCGTGRHLKLLHELGVECTGLDTSMNALNAAAALFPAPLVQADARNIPFKNGTFDIVVAWGSLHYTAKENLPDMLGEIRRVLKKGGRLFGTLRNERDTHIRRKPAAGGSWTADGGDIGDSTISFYIEEEVRRHLGPFSSFQYGTMERSLLGAPSSVIAHWYFWAEKEHAV